MSAIDELKSPTLVLDSTGEDDTSSEGIYIDASTEDTSSNRVDLSNLGKPRGAMHQVINPKSDKKENNITKIPTAPTSRREISIDAVAQAEPVDPNAHVSPIDDMINPDNPNSMFSKYVRQKDEEAREWIAERNEEQEILREEQELELDATGSESEEEYVSTSNNARMSRDDDIDLSSLLDDDKNNDREENKNMENNVEKTTINEADMNMPVDTHTEVSPDIDDGIDKDSLPDADEAVEETFSEYNDEDYYDKEESNVPASDAVIGKIDYEPEQVETPDINVEEQEDNFVTDIEEEEEDSTTEVGDVDNNEVLKHLQKLATEKLKPVSRKLDISSFTVLKKPATNINPIFQAASARVIKWVLPAQGSIVLMKEFSGAEIEKLREYSENSRSVDSLNRRFHMIYDHIVSPKPATFEQWMKTTPYEDVDHYFFAVYIASFKGANYLPVDCVNNKCNETFLTEDINIMDMVKFENNEAKDKFVKLYQSEATPAGKGVYCTEIVPITNTVAIAFRQPSIYNLIEIASLDERSRNTYSHILDYIPYIDTMYAIDTEQQTLTPINYKVFPDNAQRTIRSKIKKYESIFSLMSVDEFGPIKAYVRAITEKTTGMSYVYPAVECPKCHTLTTEQPASAEQLVFTRYQLGSLVTTSLN